MDEFVLKDYASWKIENYEMLGKMKQNENPIYDRLEPVYVVLEHLYDMACSTEELDEDLENIFNVGFQYLYSQLNIIKIYFENLFKSNCDGFDEYSEMLLFLLYIFDLRADLESHDIDSDLEVLNSTETYIENMIMERRQDFDYVREMMNKAMKYVFGLTDYEYVSIVDIYVEIAENLGIFLYEDDELIIGKEV
jgi:hypothetical protein